MTLVTTRLKIIELNKLSTKREHLSAVFIFNILHGKIDSNEFTVSIQLNENRQTRNSRYLTERNHTSANGYN
jgi:hypothetical protein